MLLWTEVLWDVPYVWNRFPGGPDSVAFEAYVHCSVKQGHHAMKG